MAKHIYLFIFLFIFLLINIAIMGFSAKALKKIMQKELSFVKRALIANGTIIIFFIAISFFELAYGGRPYDDVYVPYAFVPGIEIYMNTGYFRKYVFNMHDILDSSYAAWVFNIIYIPGLLGLILGSIKWYLFSLIWEKFKKWRKTK